MIGSGRIRGLFGTHSANTALAVASENWFVKPRSRPGPADPSLLPAVGDRVRVCQGVFIGVEGTVIGIPAPSRVLIAVDLAVQGLSIELDAAQVE